MANPAPKPRLATILAVALGGIAGASARVYAPWPMITVTDPLIKPLPTLIVNLVGAILLGCVTGYLSNRNWPEPLQKSITVGLLGSFTTMSALALSMSVLLLSHDTVSASFSWAAVGLGILYIAALLGFLALTTCLTVVSYRFGRRTGTV